jgi:hypothetical protein
MNSVSNNMNLVKSMFNHFYSLFMIF